MHVIPSGKSNGLVKVVKPPKPSLTSQTSATDGVNGEVELEGNPVESQQEQRAKFAKVYPSWQGYRSDFKLQKVYLPIATQRIGYPPEQSEEIRKSRRAI